MQPVDRMSERDLQVIHESLMAAVHGPFFDHDGEFISLMGFDRAKIAEFLEAWPQTDDPHDQDIAVNNVLNNLLGYPHDRWASWPQYSSATPQEVATVLARWRGDDHFDPGARGMFDRLR